MKMLSERPIVGLVAGLVVGILIGWLLIGWWLYPVTWTDAAPSDLADAYMADYVRMSADLYSRTLNTDAAQQRMRSWSDGGGAYYACELAQTADVATGEKQQLEALAQALGTASCDQILQGPAPEEESASTLGNLSMICGAVILAVALVGGVAFILIRRRGDRQEGFQESVAIGEPAPTLAGAPGRTIPLAQFPTEYNFGHDTYDDSFSIETATGEFLGECGVGISEAIGVGDPKKVTAFEVWLFDKNDIRTVTKVIMSEHAYYDDALRAKLAPKGEAVLAKPGETIVLETASLIINARIVEMEYGAGELPPQSFFNRMVVELAAWAKEIEELESEEPEAEADDFAL